MTFNFDFNFNFSFDGKPEAVSFSDFCEFVGYPRPFEKQIQMKNFIFTKMNFVFWMKIEY